MNTPFLPNWASKPGNTINDILNERGISVSEFAERMGWSEESAIDFIDGKLPIGRVAAELVSTVLGASVAFWLNREKQYRKSLARITNPAPADAGGVKQERM